MVLQIPGRQQKRRKHQLIPTTPAFVELLNEHPRQTCYVFDLPKLNGRPGRPTVKQVGRVVSDIGERAGVIVNDANKFASSHDLRRSFGQRLADAGIAPRDLQKIMRHKTIATTEQYYLRDNAVEIGQRIAAKLSVPGRSSRDRAGRSPRNPLKTNWPRRGSPPYTSPSIQDLKSS